VSTDDKRITVHTILPPTILLACENKVVAERVKTRFSRWCVCVLCMYVFYPVLPSYFKI